MQMILSHNRFLTSHTTLFHDEEMYRYNPARIDPDRIRELGINDRVALPIMFEEAVDEGEEFSASAAAEPAVELADTSFCVFEMEVTKEGVMVLEVKDVVDVALATTTATLSNVTIDELLIEDDDDVEKDEEFVVEDDNDDDVLVLDVEENDVDVTTFVVTFDVSTLSM